MCNKILCDINARMAVGEVRSFRVGEYASVHRVELMGRLVYCGFEIVGFDDEEVRVSKVRDVVLEDCLERSYFSPYFKNSFISSNWESVTCLPIS